MYNIYVGATRPQKLATMVLEYSIRKFASVDVNVIDLGESVKNSSVAKGTPFSLQRLFIPALNGYAGVAAYVDSDMQVFSDVRQLFALKDESAVVTGCQTRPGCTRPLQFSVFVIDCGKATHWKFDDQKLSASFNTKLDFEESKISSIPYTWNSLEFFEPDKTSLLHYTDMDTQPWISSRNKNREIWYGCLRMALDDGFISKSFIKEEVRNGNVKPSLIRFCSKREAKYSLAHAFADFCYAPPHTVKRFFRSNSKTTRFIVGVATSIYRALRTA